MNPGGEGLAAGEGVGRLLDEALQLCQRGLFTQAEAVCRRVVTRDAGEGDGWNMLAAVLHELCHYNEAWECSQEATRLRPQLPAYWLMRGNIALSRLCYADAESGFSRAIELAPHYAEAHYRRALIHQRQHRIAESIAGYRSALRYAPDVAEIYFKLGEALNEANAWEDALRAYEAAFGRDLQNALPRGNALNLINSLQWESLPAFWQNEIARNFERQDVDKSRNVSVALRALKAKPGFRQVLATVSAPAQWDDAAHLVVTSDTLFLQLLRDTLIADAAFEGMLTRMRVMFLTDAVARSRAPLEFLAALALQCFNNEFVYAASAAEVAQRAALSPELEAALVAEVDLEPALERSLAVIAMYGPLHELPSVVMYAKGHSVTSPLLLLMRRTVQEPELELTLRGSIVADDAITDGVSLNVRGMYEEHPYPRWFSIDRPPPLKLRDWIDREAPTAAASFEFAAGARVLVAGCGSGHEAIELAAGLSDVQVLAVDLSLASLAYAQRMAADLGVSNIEFRQADILGLGVLTERFSMIYCNGVLHHLQDPAAGLRVLVQLLRPRGLLRLSLYSELARLSVTAARAEIQAASIPATAAAIGGFRQFVLHQKPDSALAPLSGFLDFYSTSMCRDLMFHVQEHQMRLPQIASMLAENRLTLLAFANLAPAVMGAYLRAYPDDPPMTDCSNWDAFELQHPQTFEEMYQFWCGSSVAAF